jgi:hypothetical protein
MKLRKLVAVCSLSVFLLFPPSSLACACCTDAGQYYLGEQDLDDYHIGLLQKVKFLAADLFAGSDQSAGISFDKFGADENTNEFVIDGLFNKKTWNLNFKSLNGKKGSLRLEVPLRQTEFMVDTHDESNGTSHMGPQLYKELRFKNKVKNGTGFFREGIAKGTEYSLVLQGRGNSCTNAEDFTHWRLQINGLKADYAFWGKLRSSAQTFRITNVKSDDVLNIRPNPGDLKRISGKIPADGTGIFIIGESVRYGKSYWVPIVWKGTRGWINRKYIVQEKASGI